MEKANGKRFLRELVRLILLLKKNVLFFTNNMKKITIYRFEEMWEELQTEMVELPEA